LYFCDLYRLVVVATLFIYSKIYIIILTAEGMSLRAVPDPSILGVAALTQTINIRDASDDDSSVSVDDDGIISHSC
jgi:hypothetical protein